MNRTELMSVLHEMASSNVEAVRSYGQQIKYALKEHDQAVAEWAIKHEEEVTA